MNPPPDYLDEAKVQTWAWSGTQPFGTIGVEEDDKVFGLAICQYENTQGVYRFSCNKDWEVIQDAVYPSIELAITNLPEQYKNITPVWETK